MRLKPIYAETLLNVLTIECRCAAEGLVDIWTILYSTRNCHESHTWSNIEKNKFSPISLFHLLTTSVRLNEVPSTFSCTHVSVSLVLTDRATINMSKHLGVEEKARILTWAELNQTPNEISKLVKPQWKPLPASPAANVTKFFRNIWHVIKRVRSVKSVM